MEIKDYAWTKGIYIRMKKINYGWQCQFSLEQEKEKGIKLQQTQTWFQPYFSLSSKNRTLFYSYIMYKTHVLKKYKKILAL